MRPGDANTDELRAAIAARIEAMGWSKSKAARLGGTSPSKLVQYLKGRTHPPIDVLARLAAALGCRLVLRRKR